MIFIRIFRFIFRQIKYYHQVSHFFFKRIFVKKYIASHPLINKSNSVILSKCLHNLDQVFFFSPIDKSNIKKLFNNNYSNYMIESNVLDADEFSNYTFSFLGSDKQKLKKNFAWNMDIKSKCKWPMIKSKFVPIFKSTDSDIIRVWELSRFQWGVALGKASWFKNDTKYSEFFFNQCVRWITNNPVGFGPNWISSQDVALRAINWINSLCFFDHENIVKKNTGRMIFNSLYQHGLFLEKNLDISYMGKTKTTGTHYLSNLLGLLYLGLLFNFLKKGQEWQEYAVAEMFNEMDYQVNNDGVSYESSFAYHRFALEHFYTAYILFGLNNIEVPGSFPKKLLKMFLFCQVCNKPDSTFPIIGDNGNGRVSIYQNYKNITNNKQKYLIPIMLGLFETNINGNYSNEDSETAFWILSRFKKKNQSHFISDILKLSTQSQSNDFPMSGFYFMKSEMAYMSISANHVGMKGKGNHKHNDIFSFDLFYNDTSFIIDPGSYVYTSNLDMRHMFRSTFYHNVLQVNSLEQNNIWRDHPWRVEEKAFPEVKTWETTKDYDIFIGDHKGFSSSKQGLIHRRKIFFEKTRNIWIIQDELLNTKSLNTNDTLSFYFHLNNLLCSPVYKSKKINMSEIQIPSEFGFGNDLFDSTTGVSIESKKSKLCIWSGISNELDMEIKEGWISKSYGQKEKAPIVSFKGNFNNKTKFSFIIEAEALVQNRN